VGDAALRDSVSAPQRRLPWCSTLGPTTRIFSKTSSTSYVNPPLTVSVVVGVGVTAHNHAQGLREKRLRGEAYDQFVDKFVGLVKKHQPRCLLHFEDFVSDNLDCLSEHGKRSPLNVVRVLRMLRGFWPGSGEWI
jgi:hypothetical protein